MRPVLDTRKLYPAAVMDTMYATSQAQELRGGKSKNAALRESRQMSPYLVFGIAMLGIVIIALVVTGNLAANFNERAKRDLNAALEPLAEMLDGSVDLERARVNGRHHGQLTTAQVVSGPGGLGRLFETTFVEPAGGEAWKAVVRRPKSETESWERTFEGPDPLSDSVQPAVFELLGDLLPFPGWFELNYDPVAGDLRLTRAMVSRRDIPTTDRFERYLETLERAAAVNRAAQVDGAGATAAS
jgi:hypothetical protein